jgi:rare lipoprotein A (peptidoglycan hydrolase)
MRFLMPAAAVAALLTVGAGLATASPSKHRRSRVTSHVSLHVSRHEVLGGSKVVLRGRVRPRGEHRVKLVFHGLGGGVTGTATRPNGSFALRWAPARIGAYSVRAYGLHDKQVKGSASAMRHLTSYREAAASYYGPGLYGGGLACGGTLEPGTLGVASKTLPCGAKVKFLYRGETITVPVVDRGPYVAGRDFDLTAATRERLGFPGVGVLLSSR